MKAIKRHTREKWILLYIERWLKAEVKTENGIMEKRGKGTPQGSVISPLLSNLFLHYSFDKWIGIHHKDVSFERFADDIVCHCTSRERAESLLTIIKQRFEQVGLMIHPEKTKVVYCKDGFRKQHYPHTSFDFLGYRFRARPARSKRGNLFIGFNPAVSPKSLKLMYRTVRGWRIQRHTSYTLEQIASRINPVIRGWINYYGLYNKAELFSFFDRLNLRLSKWSCNK